VLIAFKEPGLYETMEIADVPLILTCDQNKKLRAFNNDWRHRGTRLLEGDSKCRVYTALFIVKI
jgi:phenylpropionate dioxygenase-like ring-hydroxylating dioxygenase large terminal subunit